MSCGLGRPSATGRSCSPLLRHDFAYRIQPQRELPGWMCRTAARGDRAVNTSAITAPLRVLDVGAGPLSSLGTMCHNRPVELVAVDVLAPEYDATLAALSIQPHPRTQYAPMEMLAKHFAPQYFDMVHCGNALDHAQDPFRALQQMLTIVKRGHHVVIVSLVNESTAERRGGMHQFDLFLARNSGHLMISSGESTLIDVDTRLRKTANTECKLWRVAGGRYTAITHDECHEALENRQCRLKCDIFARGRSRTAKRSRSNKLLGRGRVT